MRIGKEGPGMVYKTGMASIYGKLAQSVGGSPDRPPPFQNWIWAGMITSGCRSQVLGLIGMHRDPSNVLGIATDGVFSREEIVTPRPKDTGTFESVDKDEPIGPDGKVLYKPLGGWERKLEKKGVFFARPGIYFPLNPTEDDLKKVRARGVGREALYRGWKRVVDAWDNGDKEVSFACPVHGSGTRPAEERCKLCPKERFVGVKSGIWRKRDGTYVRDVEANSWTQQPITIQLDALPKRKAVVRVPGQSFATLSLHRRPGEFSSPYSRALARNTAEAQMLIAQEVMLAEQPDGDLSDYDYEFDAAAE